MPKGSPKGFDGHPNVVDVEIPQRIVAQRVVDALRPYERDYTEVAQEIGT